VPFNIASYALFTMMIAQVCDLELGDFVHTFGDAHLYLNHMEQVNEQLTRAPLALPIMNINTAIDSIFDFTFEDFELVNYESHAHIKAPISV
jgi:thymidylate synthase